MQTDELERQLRGALGEALDREMGPDPTWVESPAARRVAERERESRRRRWPLRVLAVAALIGAGGGAALLSGAIERPVEYANGWIAYAVAQDDPVSGPDLDIWFTAIGQEPRRVVGTDSDSVDQACPAFSPDGRRLAYGSVEGYRTTPAARMTDYRNATLVIADVADDGTVAERLTIDVGDGLPPPCPVWSPDGERLAFSVHRTSPINPTRSGDDSEVWVLRPGDGAMIVIPHLLATDLEWSPDGAMLAIAGGIHTDSGPEVIDGLQDARIHLYEPSSGTLRTLEGTLGVSGLTWSPDGGRIAYDSGRPVPGKAGGDGTRRLWVIDVETGQQEILALAYPAVHGIGPVWSPDGQTIAYQRSLGGEAHEVVLVSPDARPERTGLASEVVLPHDLTTTDGSSLQPRPWRVSWSPDGTYLLYVAWTYPDENTELTMVFAVPTDPESPTVILTEMDGIVPYDFSADAPRVPIQVWQPRSVAQ